MEEPSHIRKDRIKNRAAFLLEIAKWTLVVYLLWPLQKASSVPVSFARILLGVALFVIFAGKLLYDTVIMDLLKNRRNSTRKDLITLIGIVAGLALVIGLLILFVGFIFIHLYQSSTAPQTDG